MKQKVYVDLSEVPRYEKGNEESYEKRRRDYQKTYQKQYRKAVRDIRVRVSEEEYSRIKKRAEREDLSITGYVMSHYLSSEKREMYKSEEIRKILTEMGRIGTNINQIARSLNSSRLKIANKRMLNDLEMLREGVKMFRNDILITKKHTHAKN